MQAVECAKSCTHPALGVVEERARGALDPLVPFPRDERAPSIGAGATGGALGAQIAATLDRRAHVRKDEVEHRVLLDRTAGNTNRRDDDSLLNELGRAARHASRRHPTHIGMVRAHRGEATQGATDVDRLDESEIGQMRPAPIRIVENEHIAR